MRRPKAAAETYASIFGDRYYIEIQDNKLAEQEKVNRLLVELAKELSIPVVATNDCHYGERGGFSRARCAALRADRQNGQR